ncbi:hypothetical protein DTO166G4_3641 [Paecilomyces variotii]|uniref:Allergen Asp F4 n=1 Tax=Byssochlamys spectabilis TaxID=264951 RepID=A0A443HJY1_BYSSP|nr:allergen Asp F4 [Paecilomyces variotii]KAJ9214809.1 hypothetical protein DTO166G4_3641 [Paecilomyces variotii]KAJ9222896.1 hypothetical protein DTO169C6_4745 [Paecilomyces variotii]KAJ9237477.1 hypothetical protein DTO166G5_3567 [Paecilomyces variotii]KAJ9263767.1 hypothetical protein DTO195F2_2684 [Paecilomyces variotii]KAJ9307219.1 hypothetical protein DTO217A2_3278 [Paecilomyces variotii]
MQIKNILLLAALVTGNMARLHGHARRHAHLQAGELERRQYSPSSTATATATASASSSASSSSSSSSPSSSGSSDWLSTPSSGSYSTKGFGGVTASSGSGINYVGNVGNPWGSNIIEVSASDASQYEYVAQITGQNTEDWDIVFWNKIGPNGGLNGWYGNSALKLTLSPGETKYVAFDENTDGGFAAAPGGTIPTDSNGGYSATWGEFDFGNSGNNGWSGYDVSAIQAQAAGQTIQGMKICQAPDTACSIITPGAAQVTNAYTQANADLGGIGGNIASGPVRLSVVIDYSG